MSTPVSVNHVVIGEGLPKICVPVMGKNRKALKEEAEKARDAMPELVEWRADFFEELEKEEELIKALKEIKGILGEIPLIFTIRTRSEGGQAELSKEEYEKCLFKAAESGWAELVDVEVFETECGEKLIEALHKTGVKVIASTHNFEKTEDMETLKRRFLDMDATGADILKMAVMPKAFEDVASLMQTTHEITEEYTEKPVISMAMGNLGSISRIAGENFGSSVTFACVGAASAPGQFHIDELRMMMAALHKKNTEEE